MCALSMHRVNATGRAQDVGSKVNPATCDRTLLSVANTHAVLSRLVAQLGIYLFTRVSATFVFFCHLPATVTVLCEVGVMLHKPEAHNQYHTNSASGKSQRQWESDGIMWGIYRFPSPQWYRSMTNVDDGHTHTNDDCTSFGFDSQQFGKPRYQRRAASVRCVGQEVSKHDRGMATGPSC